MWAAVRSGRRPREMGWNEFRVMDGTLDRAGWTIGRDSDTRTHGSAPDRRRSGRLSSDEADRSNSVVPRGGSPEPSACSPDRSNAPHVTPTQVLALPCNRAGYDRCSAETQNPCSLHLSSAEIITRHPTESASQSSPEVRRTRRAADLACPFPVVYLHGVPGGPIGPPEVQERGRGWPSKSLTYPRPAGNAATSTCGWLWSSSRERSAWVRTLER